MPYGFKTINADGTTGIDSTETAVRYVANVSFDVGFTGSISVPNFDSDRGDYILTPYAYKLKLVDKIRAPDTETGQFIQLATDVAYDGTWKTGVRPITSWNNTTKLFTVSTASGRADFKVLFIHYK